MANDNFVLICGEAAGGKSASLRNIEQPEGVVYLNCEGGKKLPFRSKFLCGEDGKPGIVITDPLDIFTMFEGAEEDPAVHTIIIDTATYMMDMFESVYVLTATNTMEAWSQYAQFWKTLMRDYVATSSKNIIFLAHTSDKVDKDGIVTDRLVQVKGSLMKTGIESYFSTVVAAKKVSLKKLKKYQSANLNITAQEEIVGFKYVFQTMLTKDTVNERIRSGFEMWDVQIDPKDKTKNLVDESYIDNDINIVLDRLHEYYAD